MQDARVDEPRETLGENVRGDSQPPLELIETARSEKGLTNHETAPPVTRDTERARDRTGAFSLEKVQAWIAVPPAMVARSGAELCARTRRERHVDGSGVERLLAFRAPKDGFEPAATSEVLRLRQREPLVDAPLLAPAHRRHQAAEEVSPPFGENVLGYSTARFAEAALEHPARDELVEPVAERLAGNPEVGAERVESADVVKKRFPKNEPRPGVPYDFSNAKHGVVSVGGARRLHRRSI